MAGRTPLIITPFVVALGGPMACLDWDALYGKKCEGKWVESDKVCVVPPPPVEIICGDGVLSEGEECDDANTDDDDGCLSDCVEASCGDGLLFVAAEDCDDGNTESGDGCSDRCREEDVCGDEKVTGPEQCDDGNDEPGDGCSPDCLFEPDPILCGNGELDESEICDDGNVITSDACSAGCTWSVCGDGVLRRGVEECDDGNADNRDGCTRSCLICDQEGSRHRVGNDHCYVFHEEKLTRDEARATCVEEGGYLWTATSQGEVFEIKRQLINEEEVWVGLHRVEGEFAWVTSERFNYAPWLDGFPTGGSCVVQLVTAESEANFRNRICTVERAFVCEFEPAFIDPVSHVAYRRFWRERPIEEARAACEEEGGRLATPSSDEELALLADEFKGTAWVDTAADPDCEAMQEGELTAQGCDTPTSYICEFL